MDLLVLIGRIMFSAVFLGSGAGHLTKTDMMTGYAGSKGVPWARQAVLVGGVMIVAGGLGVLLGIWLDLAALLLVIFLIPTAILMHGFWKEGNEEEKQAEMTQFMKDMALAGAALMLFALFREFGDSIGLTITGPLF